MKTFELRIEKVAVSNITEYVWPEWWETHREEIEIVATDCQQGVFGPGAEGMLCVCELPIWKKIKDDERVSLLTDAQANAKGLAWRPRRTQVSDQDAVLMVLAKAVRGEQLTGDEEKVIDPDDFTAGINREQSFDMKQVRQVWGQKLKETNK